jgi:hypothetical protein
MADLTSEQFEQLPDFLKDDYTEVDGVFKHAGMMKVKQTANDLDLRLKANAADKKLADESKAAEITAAIEEALLHAIEKGDTKEQLRLEREKLDDAQNRINTEREELEGIQGLMANDKQSTVIERLSLKATDIGRAAFKRLVKDFILVDAKTRQVTFLNEDGSASSLNEEDFYKEVLSKSSLFKSVLKADITTNGGGNANGSMDSSASQKAPKEMTGQERVEFKKRDPAGFKQAFNL